MTCKDHQKPTVWYKHSERKAREGTLGPTSSLMSPAVFMSLSSQTPKPMGTVGIDA